jgi:hypothetical protein
MHKWKVGIEEKGKEIVPKHLIVDWDYQEVKEINQRPDFPVGSHSRPKFLKKLIIRMWERFSIYLIYYMVKHKEIGRR